MTYRFGSSDKVTEAMEVLTLIRNELAATAGSHPPLTLDSTTDSFFTVTPGTQKLIADSTVARGDLMIADNSPNLVRLSIGTSGTFLGSDGSDPSWDTLDTGDLTDLDYGTPALTFSTSNAAGSADSVIRTDATIALFDATDPVDVGTSPATGSAGVAARRDHVHQLDIAGQTEDASPASNDWILTELNAGGTFRKVQVQNLTSISDHVHSATAGQGGATISATTFNGTATVSAAWTHSNSITMDDGTGDSPQLQFVGGSNDDTANIFLDDDATAGNSDLVIQLVAADDDARLIVRDSVGNDVMKVGGNGDTSLFNGATETVKIRASGDVSGTESDIYCDASGGFAADERVGIFIDADNSETGQYFAVLHNDDDFTNATELYRLTDTGWMGLNETANTNMTIGFTINQGTNSDEMLTFKATNVAHGFTTIAETDTFLTFRQVESGSGGGLLRAVKDSGGVNYAALYLQGSLAEDTDTTKTTAARGIVELWGHQSSGNAYANTVADGNVFVVRTRRGGSFVSIMFVDEDGDLYYDATLHQFDDENDALAVRDLAQGLAGNWNRTIDYNRERFEELGIISAQDEHGRAMISSKNLNALMMGAIGQLYHRMERAGI